MRRLPFGISLNIEDPDAPTEIKQQRVFYIVDPEQYHQYLSALEELGYSSVPEPDQLQPLIEYLREVRTAPGSTQMKYADES